MGRGDQEPGCVDGRHAPAFHMWEEESAADAPSKIPPLLNLVGAEPQALGWAAVVGLLRPVWAASVAGAGEGYRFEWIYVVSDEPLVPVLMACRSESAPSVLFCPLHKVSNVGELAERVGNTLETSEGVPPLPWGDLGLR